MFRFTSINSALTQSTSGSFTEEGYTISYKKWLNVVTVVVIKNNSVTTNVDYTTTGTVPIPFNSIGVTNYSGGDNNFIEISYVNGTVRIVHKANSGWFKCVATYIT